MLLSHHQNAGQNHDMKIANRCFEKCGTIQIFGNDNNFFLLSHFIFNLYNNNTINKYNDNNKLKFDSGGN
jgi:hypothetical protein